MFNLKINYILKFLLSIIVEAINLKKFVPKMSTLTSNYYLVGYTLTLLTL